MPSFKEIYKTIRFKDMTPEEKRIYMCQAKARHRARQKGLLPPVQKRTEEEKKAYQKRYQKKYRPGAKFGLKIHEYEALVKGKECRICKGNKKIVLDHCHDTGNIRGPLCDYCNRGLGFFRDDPERLRAAALYVETAKLFA